MARDEPYNDRRDAGRVLAEAAAAELRDWRGLIVLALPRGGVPVGFEVARRLAARLDLMLVRKLGVPGQEELAMGAVATGNVRVLNTMVVAHAGVSEATLEEVTRKERAELERRLAAYRGDAPPIELAGRSIVLVDDGLATGASMRAAVEAAHQSRPARLAVAVPVAATDTAAELRSRVDAMICPWTPSPFQGVGRWYRDFSQTSDDEVRALLQAHRASSDASSGSDKAARRPQE